MKGRLNGRFILYTTITTTFLIHWVHNDLESDTISFGVSLLNNFWQVAFVVGVNMVYFEYALPFVTSGKIHRAITIPLSIIAQLIVLALGLYAWRNLGFLLHIYSTLHPLSGIDGLSAAIRLTPGAFLIFAVFKLFFDYTQLKYEGQKVLTEKKQAELLFLKSQINPHFLFNTLNNIYSLSQHQPQLVSESILRLSKILRYLLYETDIAFITIDKEMKILSDYIDLEKLRYNESVAIDFIHDVDNANETIPPLLLIPLVENAFKHGVSQFKGKRFVDVQCMLSQRQLRFTVRNASHPVSEPTKVKDNIGLSNLRRRLELLYKDFELVTGEKDSIFTATLTINLSSHV